FAVQGKALILHMRTVGDHQCRTGFIACIYQYAMATSERIISISRPAKMTDVLPFGIVLYNIILTIAIHYINISVSRINGCFCRHKLSWILIYARLFGIIQLKDFFSFEVRLDDLVAIGIRDKKKLLIPLRT